MSHVPSDVSASTTPAGLPADSASPQSPNPSPSIAEPQVDSLQASVERAFESLEADRVPMERLAELYTGYADRNLPDLDPEVQQHVTRFKQRFGEAFAELVPNVATPEHHAGDGAAFLTEMLEDLPRVSDDEADKRRATHAARAASQALPDLGDRLAERGLSPSTFRRGAVAVGQRLRSAHQNGRAASLLVLSSDGRLTQGWTGDPKEPLWAIADAEAWPREDPASEKKATLILRWLHAASFLSPYLFPRWAAQRGDDHLELRFVSGAEAASGLDDPYAAWQIDRYAALLAGPPEAPSPDGAQSAEGAPNTVNRSPNTR